MRLARLIKDLLCVPPQPLQSECRQCVLYCTGRTTYCSETEDFWRARFLTTVEDFLGEEDRAAPATLHSRTHFSSLEFGVMLLCDVYTILLYRSQPSLVPFTVDYTKSFSLCYLHHSIVHPSICLSVHPFVILVRLLLARCFLECLFGCLV